MFGWLASSIVLNVFFFCKQARTFLNFHLMIKMIGEEISCVVYTVSITLKPRVIAFKNNMKKRRKERKKGKKITEKRKKKKKRGIILKKYQK